MAVGLTQFCPGDNLTVSAPLPHSLNMSKLLLSAICLLLSSACLPVTAQETERQESFDRDTALAFSQAAIGRQLGNYSFADSGGATFSLRQFAGRPVVLSMIFTSCRHTCPLITRNLRKTVAIAREALGENSFAVVSVGFDWRADTPSRMAMFKNEMGVNEKDWLFVSADEDTIKTLSEDIGFIFFPSASGFDHLAQTTVIDKQGKVFWQVYGANFEAPHLVEPLKRLVFDTRDQPLSLGSWIENVKLFCTVFDPTSGRYRFDYSIIVALFTGILSLGAVAVFIVRSWRQST